jgi:hypothetical protein
MPASPQDILQAFDSLPQAEQRTVAEAILRRLSPWGVDSMDDSDLSLLAEELFCSLDAQENS